MKVASSTVALGRAVATSFRRWWYGALVPEWPGLFKHETKFLALYVSPKAAQWLPIVTVGNERSRLKSEFERRRSLLEDLQRRLARLARQPAPKPPEDLLAEAAAARVDLEAADAPLRGARWDVVRTIYDTLYGLQPPIRYTVEPFSSVQARQTIRTPGEILESLHEGTCLDLAALFCGLCLSQKLLPMMILLQHPATGERHAFAAVSLDQDFDGWDFPDRYGGDLIRGDELKGASGADALHDWVQSGRYRAVECTGFAVATDGPAAAGRVDGLLTFDQAVAIGGAWLTPGISSGLNFEYALDVATAQNAWGLTPYEPRKVYGERRLAQMRRGLTRLITAGLAALAALLYGTVLMFHQVDRWEKDFVDGSKSERIWDMERPWPPVSWLTARRLKDGLISGLAATEKARNSNHADYLSRAALGVFALSGGADKSSLVRVLGGRGWYHPQARSDTVERLPKQGQSAEQLAGWLDDEAVRATARGRQAVVLAVGLTAAAIPKQATCTVLEKLKSVYNTDDDPGVHSAAEWAIRKVWPREGTSWVADRIKTFRGKGINRLKERNLGPDRRQWFVDSLTGLTMVYFPPDEKNYFEVGDLDQVDVEPDERSVNVWDRPPRVAARIDCGFCLAAVETPVAVYAMNPYDDGLRASVAPKAPDRSGLKPATATWFEATLFCNLRDPRGNEGGCYTEGKYPNGTGKIYTVLNSSPSPDTRYRLPSEVEWEYAARGASLDQFFSGRSSSTLSEYGAVHFVAEPVGTYMPNGFGLFDVHGNVEEYCNDEELERNPHKYSPTEPLSSHRPLRAADRGGEGTLYWIKATKRVKRGGLWIPDATSLAVFARKRCPQDESGMGGTQGFRLAMSLSRDWWGPPRDAGPTRPPEPSRP